MDEEKINMTSKALADLPLRLGELHHRFRVASKRFRRYGLPFQSLIRINRSRRQAQIDDLPELIDLILEVTDRGVAILERLFEHFDDLVAMSQRLRTLVQQSLQVSYRIHSPSLSQNSRTILFLEQCRARSRVPYTAKMSRCTFIILQRTFTSARTRMRV